MKQHTIAIDFLKTNQIKSARVIYFCSPQKDGGKFDNGIYIVPVPITNPNDLISLGKDIFQQIKTTFHTHSWLPFDKMSEPLYSKDLLSIVKDTTVFFATDGTMYDGTTSQQCMKKFETSFLRFKQVSPHVNITIVTVEATNTNYDTLVEGSSTKPGGDIYKALQQIGRTNDVEKFVSYTTAGMFVQTSNIKSRPGYIMFQGKEYLKSDDADIFNFVKTTIVPQIAQKFDFVQFNKLLEDLAGLIYVISNDLYNPEQIIASHIADYTSIFQDAVPDINFFRSTLQQLVSAKQSGQGMLRSDIERLRRNKFDSADASLVSNTLYAVGNSGQTVCTIPCVQDGVLKVVVFPRQLVSSTFGKYKNSSVQIDNNLFPIVPIDFNSSEQSEQCLRQWIRQIVSKMLNIDEKSNYIVLYMGCIALLSKLNNSSLTQSFINLFKVTMLKTRPRSQTTEFDFLKQGNPPTELIKDIGNAIRYFGFSVRPYTLWYIMATTLDIHKMQFNHCKADLALDNVDPDDPFKSFQRFPVVSVLHVPTEYKYDYTCPITLCDTSVVGGYTFAPHKSQRGSDCNPVFVISQQGVDETRQASPVIKCFACNTNVNVDSFIAVRPLVPIDLTSFSNLPGVYRPGVQPVKAKRSAYNFYVQPGVQAVQAVQSIQPAVQANNPLISLDTISLDYIIDNYIALISQHPDNVLYSRMITRSKEDITKLKNTLSTISDDSGIKFDIAQLDRMVAQQQPSSNLPDNRFKKIIVLKGTVGSGKTTVTELIVKAGNNLNIKSHVISFDEKMTQGKNAKQAFGEIKYETETFKNSINNRKMLIIDACGERFNQSDIFGVDFSNDNWMVQYYTPNLYGDVATIPSNEFHNYLTWSLYNVLNRGKPSLSSKFNLSPFNHSTPFQKCIDIHKSKAISTFTQRNDICDLVKGVQNVKEALSMLQDRYDLYSHFLSKHNLLTDIDILFR